MFVLSNNSWVEQPEAFVHAELLESSVETAASRFTCDTAFSLQKSHIYLSRKLKNVAFTSHKNSHFSLLPWERYEVR